MLSTFHVALWIVANISKSSRLFSPQLFRPYFEETNYHKTTILIFRIIPQNIVFPSCFSYIQWQDNLHFFYIWQEMMVYKTNFSDQITPCTMANNVVKKVTELLSINYCGLVIDNHYWLRYWYQTNNKLLSKPIMVPFTQYLAQGFTVFWSSVCDIGIENCQDITWVMVGDLWGFM